MDEGRENCIIYWRIKSGSPIRKPSQHAEPKLDLPAPAKQYDSNFWRASNNPNQNCGDTISNYKGRSWVWEGADYFLSKGRREVFQSYDHQANHLWRTRRVPSQDCRIFSNNKGRSWVWEGMIIQTQNGCLLILRPPVQFSISGEPATNPQVRIDGY